MSAQKPREDDGRKPRSREQIRRNMSSVRCKDTLLERRLGRALWKAGLRYRKHYDAEGKPDFVLVRTRIAVFCDSHFWHGYDWDNRKHDHRQNVAFWHAKIERNMARDAEVSDKLQSEGWAVVRLWEHEIKTNLDECVARVVALHQQRLGGEPAWT